MLVLPIYRIGSVFYLHTRVGGRQIKRSLRTSYQSEAIIRAVKLLHELSMKKDLPAKYEIDAVKGILKADGPEDHIRLMQAIEAMKAMQAGQATPALQATTAPADDPNALKLPELLEKFFFLRKQLTQATAIAYKNCITELAKFLKNPPITRVEPSDITRYQEFLAAKGNTPRTIDNKVAIVRALFNFAIKQVYIRGANPAANRAILTKKQKLKGGYAIFETEEITRFLTSDFFAEQLTKDPDYTSAVLVGLFTGCRISEITSLRKEQLKISAGGTHYLVLRESKTMAGVREVPLHPFLLQQIAPHLEKATDKIFKYTERDGKGSGNAVGKKFDRNLTSAGIARDKLVFHSLRKFVNDQMAKNGVSLEHRCQLVGHELENVNVATYTNKIGIDDLAAAVFPTFGLIAQTVKKALDPMRGVDLGDVLNMDELL